MVCDVDLVHISRLLCILIGHHCNCFSVDAALLSNAAQLVRTPLGRVGKHWKWRRVRKMKEDGEVWECNYGRKGWQRWDKRQTEGTFGEQCKVLCMALNSHMTHAAGTGTVRGRVLGSKSCSCSDKKRCKTGSSSSGRCRNSGSNIIIIKQSY